MNTNLNKLEKLEKFFSNINISYSSLANYITNNPNNSTKTSNNSRIRANNSATTSNNSATTRSNNSATTRDNRKSNNKFIKTLFVKSFGESSNVTNTNILNINTQLNETILKNLESIKNKESTGWVYCSKACSDILQLFKIEIESTLYMLNIISNSLVSIDGSSVIFKLRGTISNLTGIWNDDKDKFTFEIYSKIPQNTKTRLIMGFGPSASGKTYCAKAIITMLSTTDPSFPKSFLSIDGGLYREKSYIYQKLIELIKHKRFKGLKNLVLSGHHLKTSKTNFSITERETLFDSGIVKKKVTEYLISLSKKVSLYVPETLGGCLIDCSSVYKKYIEIADDSLGWIGLLIWQHKKHDECDYIEGYQCAGCTESGQKRETNEGKIYSSTAWGNSMANGRTYMMKAPGGMYEIHNGGGYKYIVNGKDNLSKSVIIDHSLKKILNKIPNGFYSPSNIKTIKKATILNRLKSGFGFSKSKSASTNSSTKRRLTL